MVFEQNGKTDAPLSPVVSALTFSYRQRSLFGIFLATVAFVLSLTPGKAAAHHPHDVIEFVQISPYYGHDKSVFIFFPDGKVFKTKDGGSSWKQLAKGMDFKTPITHLAISPFYDSDKALFLSTSGDGIYRSVDGGASWTRSNRGLDTPDIRLLAISTNYLSDQTSLAAGSRGELFRSQDRGESWSSVMTNAFPISALAFFPNPKAHFAIFGDTDGRLQISMDRGNIWAQCYKFSGAGSITAIAVAPSNTSTDPVIFVGTENNGVFKSLDGGRTFDAANNGITDTTILSVVVSPEYAVDGTVFASSWHQGVFRSTDDGNTWHLQSNGLTTDSQADTPGYLSPHFRNLCISKSFGIDRTLFVAGFDGVFKTTDGASTWRQLETLSPKRIVDLAITQGRTEGSRLVAVGTYGGGVYVTGDEGKSWIIKNKGLERTRVSNIAFSPEYPSDKLVYSAIQGALLASANGWDSWQNIDLHPKTWRSYARSLLRKLGAPDRIGQWLTTETERKGVPYPTVICLSPTFRSDHTLYFGTRRHGLFRSKDEGHHNTIVWDGRGECIDSVRISPMFSSDQTIYAALRGTGVYQSTDEGKTWHRLNVVGPQASASEHAFSVPFELVLSPNYPSDGAVFVGSGEGLFLSEDRGGTWKRMPVAGSSREIVKAVALSPEYVDDATVMVSVEGLGLFVSTDRGANFSETGFDLINHNYCLDFLEFSPLYGKDSILYGASDEEVFVSPDQGATWTVLPRPLRYEDERDEVRYEGTWQKRKDCTFSGCTVMSSEGPNSRATLDFFGSGISLIASTDSSRGTATVYIDGVYRAIMDQFTETSRDMAECFIASDLTAGAHTIAIEVTHTQNPKSSGYHIEIDAFDVTP